MPACYAMRRRPAQTKKPRITRGFRGRPCRWPSLFLVLPSLLLVLVALLLFLLLFLLLVAPAFLLLAALILGILLALLGHGRSPVATGEMPGWGNAVQRQVKDAWEKPQKIVTPAAPARAHAAQCLQWLRLRGMAVHMAVGNGDIPDRLPCLLSCVNR